MSDEIRNDFTGDDFKADNYVEDANEAYDSIRMLSTRLEKEVESNKNLNQNIQKMFVKNVANF